MSTTEETLDNITGIMMILRDDLAHASSFFNHPEKFRQLSVEDQKFWYRTLIRTFFAYVEGSTFALKQAAYEIGKHYGYPFSAAEIMVITEEVPKLQKGKIATDIMKISIMENILYSFDLFVKVFGMSPSLDLTSHKRDAFRKMIRVRDGLMHPKSTEALEPLDSVQDLLDSRDWFVNALEEAMNQASTIMKSGKSPSYT